MRDRCDRAATDAVGPARPTLPAMGCVLLVAVLLGADAGSTVAVRDPFERAIPVPAAQFSFEQQDDLDYDNQPDDWTRRRGPGFPHYLDIELDSTTAHDGERSLRLEADGGKAAIYSPPIPISPHYSYIFSGRVRTQRLQHDAALLTVSFLNARKQRVRRVVGPPVTGSSTRWSEVRIGPVQPTEDVRYVVIGCHLVHEAGGLHGELMDYRGAAWFDAFSLRMLPRLSLKTNFEQQCRGGAEPIDVQTIVSGLDNDGRYELKLFLEDATFVRRQQRDFDLSGEPHDPAAPLSRRWMIPPQPNGFYRLHAHLLRDGEVMLEEMTSLAVVDPAPPIGEGDEAGFGWSLDRWPHDLDHARLLAVAGEAGVDWIKLPLWDTVEDAETASGVTTLLGNLRKRGVQPAGILKEPPREVRRKFADDWAGVSELFTMPPTFWTPSVDPVLARYSQHVRYWQLGGESDTSFTSIPRLPEQLSGIKKQFDRLGRDVSLGVHWEWGRPIPDRRGFDHPFLSLSARKPLDESELIALLEKSAEGGFDRWVLLKARPRTLSVDRGRQARDLDRRAADLLRRIVAARIGQAEVIFAADVFHPRTGLLREDGSPGELFLPWRTAAIALRDADYLGSFRLPNQSPNHVFARRRPLSERQAASRDGSRDAGLDDASSLTEEAVVFVWNDETTREPIVLGPDLHEVNLWGQHRKLPVEDGRPVVTATRVPTVLRGGSAQMARFRLGVRFDKGRMPSSTDEFFDELVIENPFPQGVSGNVEINVPREWEVRPRTQPFAMKVGQQLRIPVILRVPSHTSLGPQPIRLDFRMDADSYYRFRVVRDYTVGLGDVTIDVATEVIESDSGEDELEVRQTIVNHTTETLEFRVSLFVPGHKRYKRRVAELGEEESNVITYRVGGATELIGQTLRIRAEQEGGNRVLNKSWTFEGE